jgi:purine-binding chemotaxis protein CheW
MLQDTDVKETGGHLATEQLVTVIVEGQLLGLPISRVHDVFAVQNLTVVPRSQAAVAGLVNLRGRVVTMLSLRVMLGFEQVKVEDGAMAVGIEWKDEALGLVVDEVGEVLEVERNAREIGPTNLDPRWSQICAGIHKLEKGLLVEIDLSALLERPLQNAA